MRIYEGSPRRDFEEVLRSIGTFLDQRGMREVLFLETSDGFIVQGMVPPPGPDAKPAPAADAADAAGAAPPTAVAAVKETLLFSDDDVNGFIEEATTRRRTSGPRAAFGGTGYYELALRVIGAYIDQQSARDVFFFEQDGAFVVRLLMGTQAGPRHVLSEFTRQDMDAMIEQRLILRATEEVDGSGA